MTTMTTITEPIPILDIANDIWISLLGIPLMERPPEAEVGPITTSSMTATVHITGMTEISIVLSSSTPLAQRVAAMMFELDVEDLANEEVADAFGEIANIVAGSVKSLLPEPSRLSLPAVSRGADLVVTIPGAHLLESRHFDCCGEPLTIALWQNTGADTHVDAGRPVQ